MKLWGWGIHPLSHENQNRNIVSSKKAVNVLSVTFDREQIKLAVAELAAKGVYLGTSSWKYEGWMGQLYTPTRYEYRGKVAKTRFERGCLSEYAEAFKTVSVDAAYYDFPRPEFLQKLADAVPGDFQFGFKVTDTVEIKKFPNLPRLGAKAGQPNQDFLNADLFATAFLKPCEDKDLLTAWSSRVSRLVNPSQRFKPVLVHKGHWMSFIVKPVRGEPVSVAGATREVFGEHGRKAARSRSPCERAKTDRSRGCCQGAKVRRNVGKQRTKSNYGVSPSRGQVRGYPKEFDSRCLQPPKRQYVPEKKFERRRRDAPVLPHPFLT